MYRKFIILSVFIIPALSLQSEILEFQKGTEVYRRLTNAKDMFQELRKLEKEGLVIYKEKALYMNPSIRTGSEKSIKILTGMDGKLGLNIGDKITKGNIQEIKILLQRGLDPNISPENSSFPDKNLLYSAISSHYPNRTELIQLLMKHGAKPYDSIINDIAYAMKNIRSPEGIRWNLMVPEPPSEKEAIAWTEMFIKAGAPVNYWKGTEKTPLTVAVLYHKFDYAEYLISRGADVN